MRKISSSGNPRHFSLHSTPHDFPLLCFCLPPALLGGFGGRIKPLHRKGIHYMEILCLWKLCTILGENL